MFKVNCHYLQVVDKKVKKIEALAASSVKSENIVQDLNLRSMEHAAKAKNTPLTFFHYLKVVAIGSGNPATHIIITMPADVRQMDQINECDLEVISSRLILSGCLEDLDTALRIDLAKGWYRVRLYYGALHTLSANRRTGGDFYEIQLWPSTEQKGLAVIRQKTV